MTANEVVANLRRHTQARIGLGRCGAGLPTVPLLDFQLAHARARDAVHAALDVDAITAALAPHPVHHVTSLARDRATYLRRPDLGRRLDPDAALEPSQPDLALVIADGLSARAVNLQAATMVYAVAALIGARRLAPIVIATQARVALGDAIGQALGARIVAVLIGERPGLTASDSLGIYMTYRPRIGCVDSERNCLSNIRPGGMSLAEAAARLMWLVAEAERLETSGTALKDNYTPDPALDLLGPSSYASLAPW